jgi:hypothetical protein
VLTQKKSKTLSVTGYLKIIVMSFAYMKQKGLILIPLSFGCFAHLSLTVMNSFPQMGHLVDQLLSGKELFFLVL